MSNLNTLIEDLTTATRNYAAAHKQLEEVEAEYARVVAIANATYAAKHKYEMALIEAVRECARL